MYGAFQITDFGVSKFHELGPQDLTKGTTHPRGTVTYSGPESRISRKESGNNKGKLYISRPYDVWAFGCIMLEVLVWLFLGKSRWESFSQEREGPVEEGNESEYSDAFWIGSPHLESAVVRPAVTTMLQTLRASHCVKTVRSLTSLIDLIERMLIIEPTSRESIGQVLSSLKEILSSARVDSGWERFSLPRDQAHQTSWS
jgi:serine/threonine protein kinase